MSRLATRAHGDDFVALGDIELGNHHFLPKHLGHEWKGEIFLDQGEETASLLRFAVGVGGCLLYQLIQVFRGELRRLSHSRLLSLLRLLPKPRINQTPDQGTAFAMPGHELDQFTIEVSAGCAKGIGIT